MANIIGSCARQARFLFWHLNSYRYLGEKFACPICEGRFREMMPFRGIFNIRGVPTDHYTPNAVCPRCRSVARQRFVVEYIRQRTDLLKGRSRVLHFAPEISIYNLFKGTSADYVAADIDPSRYAGKVARADVTAVPFPADSFDALICIHVLEHVVDDQKAMAEFFRVLRPGGQAIIAVPTYGARTFEDTSLDFAGRELQYGIGDHVRMNGLDFANRLEVTGFAVQIVSMDDVGGTWLDRTVQSPHTDSDRYLFICTK